MDGADRPVCVLWVGESGAVPSSLVVILRDQGLEVVVAREAPEVMVELAAAVRGGGELPTVVVVEPGGRPRVGELMEAVARYHPGVVCWRYEAVDGSGPRLMPFDETVGGTEAADGDPSARAAGAPPASRVKGARQRLRSVVVKVGRRAGDLGRDGDDGPHRPLVSEAELAMLLRPVTDEDAGREKGLKGA